MRLLLDEPFKNWIISATLKTSSFATKSSKPSFCWPLDKPSGIQEVQSIEVFLTTFSYFCYFWSAKRNMISFFLMLWLVLTRLYIFQWSTFLPFWRTAWKRNPFHKFHSFFIHQFLLLFLNNTWGDFLDNICEKKFLRRCRFSFHWTSRQCIPPELVTLA